MLQQTALEILKLGANVFLTGSAGSGKSYTLGLYIEELKKNQVKDHVIAVTATTGIAATLIGGSTIHSFACIGIHEYLTDEAIQKIIQKRRKAVDKIDQAKVLILDEISMLHRRQLELASRVISIVKQNSEPFGGMQVIVTGDFFQLPPVQKAETKEENRDRFCFMSPVWVEANFKVCYLTEQHRSKGGTLNQILNAIRSQSVTEEHIEILRSRKVDPTKTDILNLYTHNEDVDYINFTQLQKIKGETYRFKAENEGEEKPLQVLINSVMAPQNLELKLGAKVMFVKNNLDAGYANGTQGVVEKFIPNEECDPPFTPVVKTTDGLLIEVEPDIWELDRNGKVVAKIKQLPLRLAWAITIHKSQGMSLDEARINLGRTFEKGQGYVAISRLRSIEGLYVEDIGYGALDLNPLAIKADARFRELSEINETLILNQSEVDRKKLQQTYIKSLLR